jgi:hypothetical protein
MGPKCVWASSIFFSRAEGRHGQKQKEEPSSTSTCSSGLGFEGVARGIDTKTNKKVQ